MVTDKFAFLTRYCFSCLVDADSIDTAHFCNGDIAKPLKADFSACLKRVEEKLQLFSCETTLQKARNTLQQQVFEKAEVKREIYLMNMPTGSGKTLCSVKFALQRAVSEGKKRIIYVIPYNSIIDQTADIFEKLFQGTAEILRHQSTFSYEDEEQFDEDYRKSAKNAAENWDAPFIITTAVQFFQSIYANKRGKLRKLHNMSDSILIFDEAHLMPQDSKAKISISLLPQFPGFFHGGDYRVHGRAAKAALLQSANPGDGGAAGGADRVLQRAGVGPGGQLEGGGTLQHLGGVEQGLLPGQAAGYAARTANNVSATSAAQVV